MSDNRFLDALEKRVILGAGAMGTELLRRGALADRPVDEINLSRPHLVLDLSSEYVRAGAELIKTNTFLANRFRVGAKAREINLAGAQIARDAAKGAFVAGCVGPLHDRGSDFLVYREQCEALAEGGCDVILLETFMNFADLQVGMKAAWTTGLPVICQVAQGKILEGLKKLTETDADVVGVNCVDVEKASMALGVLGRSPTIHRSAFPNGSAPEAFGQGIGILVEAGARLVGGCCGAGPEHIAAAAQAVGKGR